MRLRHYSMVDYFIEREKEIKPALHFAGKTQKDFEKWHAKFETKVLELLGEFPAQVPLDAEVVASVECERYVKEKVIFNAEKHASIPAYVLIPKDRKSKQKLPAIVCSHGHGAFGKETVAGAHGSDPEKMANISLHNYNYAEQMAERGFVTIAPDLRCFGERDDGGDPYPGRDKCNVHFIRGLLMGIVLLGLNIWDMMKTVDYLCERPEVDPERIGFMGLSQGGTMTTYTAALEKRIKAADIIGYLTVTREYAIRAGNFCGSQLVPHLYRYGDVADVAGLIAPRPLLVEAGMHDNCFSIESMVEAHAHLKKIYKAAGSLDKLEVEVFDGGHQFAGGKAFDFFAKWL